MPLPKINAPQYDLTLPSNGKKVIFRPMTVAEQKILLIAMEDEEQAQVRALRQVINNCLITDVNVDALPMFDLDYIWIKLRSKSIDDVVSIPFECRKALPEDKVWTDDDGVTHDTCETVVNIAMNLDTIEVKKYPENNPRIDIQDGIGILMRYPTFETVQKLSNFKASNDIDVMFEVIMECVELIYEGEKTYERENIDKKELQNFLESLTEIHFKKVMEFFDTLPVLRHQVHFRCPKCKHEVDIVVEGTKSFLASDSATIQ